MDMMNRSEAAHGAGYRGWLPVVGGSALALYGMTRSRASMPAVLTGVTVALLGLAAGTRPAQRPVRRAHVRRALTVRRPKDELYAFWRELENLPQVMHHLERVEKTAEGRYRFTARAPLGSGAVSWEAAITDERSGELLAWQSLEGAPLRHSGRVEFREAPGDRGTEVHVVLDYQPTGAGAMLPERLLGAGIAQAVEEEIRGFKEFMEAGEIASTEGQPTARSA